jgi:hypothetical protein
MRLTLNISKTSCNFPGHVHCRFQLDLDPILSFTQQTNVTAWENLRGMEIKQREAVSNPGCWNMFSDCLTTIWGVITVLSLTAKPEMCARAVVICHLVFASLPRRYYRLTVEYKQSGSCVPRCQRHAIHFHHQNVHTTIMTTFVSHA